MNLFIEHKRIISFVAALMVAVLVVYSYGSFRSYAAALEVSTLPADIDIDVTYDADTVTFTYNNVTHSIDRNTRYEYINSSSTSCPTFLERTSTGYFIPASYWFSPSENRLYVFSGCTVDSVSSKTTLFDFCYILGYVPGPNNATTDIVGNFYLHNDASGYHGMFMYFIDYNFGYVCNTYQLYSDDGWSKDRNICSWYPNIAKINGEDACKILGASSTERYYFPADLICVFSNYEISGFYEFDNSKVNTPSYYFNFQYIFYKEKYGYIFVDSAKRVREVGFPNNVNNPRFFFEDICNSYVYSSSDGVSWTLLTTTSTAYAKYFEVSTGTSWTDYTLIYTNDKSFGGDPLVTPDYGDITDVTDNLNSFLKDFDIISSSGRGSSITSLDYLIVEFPADNSLLSSFVGSFTLDYVYYCTYKFYYGSGTTSMPEYIHVYYFGGTVYDNVIVKSSSDTGNKFFDFLNGTLIDPNNSYQLVSTSKVPTFSMYFRLLNNTTSNIFTSLTALRTDLHADLKSVFTNITLTNQYLKRISDNLDSLSIPAASPDYSSQFDKLSAALDKLHNDLIYEEGVTKLPNVPQYLVYIYGVTKDIRTRLDTIISKMPAGSGSVDVDTDSIVTAINESATSLTATVDSGTDKLHSDLNYIKALMTIDTVNKLFGDDNDSQNIFNFVSKGIASIVSGSIISDALAFSTQTKDGIVYISSYVNKFYDAVPVYSSIVTVGASFFIIDMVLRRKS